MTTIELRGGLVLLPDLAVTAANVIVDQRSGTILSVGEDADGDRVLDCSGGLVMPGLVNGHCHVAMTLLRGLADDKPLERWLREDIWPVEAVLTPEDVNVGATLGIAEMIASGTTCFADMYFHVPEIVAAVESAGIRARLGHGIISIGKDEDAAWSDLETGVEFAETYSETADGRISTAIMPHALTTVGRDYLVEAVSQSERLDVPVHYHSNETVTDVESVIEEHGSRPIEYARQVGATRSSDFIAHGVHVDEAERSILADSGPAVVHCPASNMKLASGMAPIQRMLDAGIVIGLGTDGPASNNDLDMFGEMRDAAMIGKLAAKDASAVSAASVVEMATQGSAQAIGMPGGRIEAGYPADIAVIDLETPRLKPAHDVVSHLVYAVNGSDVRHTICAGRILMRDRIFQTLDVGDVMRDAEERAVELVDRARE